MWRRRIEGAGLGLVVALAGAGQAEAAGFALKEQSATAQGNAFAGATAGAEDASYMFFNPAALGYIEGIEAEAVVSYVAPRAELKDASATTGAGTPVGGRDDDDDIGENAFVPALYAAGKVPGGLHLGVGISAPFGLETNYSESWVGRYHGIKSELLTVNINPALAWRPVPWFSAGVGLQAQYADGELTQAVDFGTIGADAGIPGAVPGAQDGFAKVEGDDWAYGFTAGLILEPVTGTKLGVAYRSEIEHTLEGDADFRDDAAGVAATLRGVAGLFADTGAQLDVNTPASLSFGVHQTVTPRFAVMAEAQWTDWSTFHELKIEFDNPAQPDSITEQEWEDSWFFALGATFKATDQLTLRGGVAYDQSPVKDQLRTPRIPDEDRYWLSLGLGWQPVSWAGLDLAYTHIFVNDSEVDLSTADRGNATRGSLRAEYENSIDILAVSAKVRF